MRHIAHDITKHYRKFFFQNYDFLVVWNANLNIYKNNFFDCHYFSRKPYLHLSLKLDMN